MRYSNTLHYQLQAQNAEKLERLYDARTDWRRERLKANRLVKLYHLAGYEDYADRAENCSTWLQFRVDGQGNRALSSANFCNLRLCPICIARGASARAKLLSRVMDMVVAEHKCQYIFLTLTVRNCAGADLGSTISVLTEGWNRFIRQRPVARAVMGWFRALEITRNFGEGTFHPHLHVILAVEDAYFAPKSPLYLTHADIKARWQKAAKLGYDPRVYIEKTTTQEELKKAKGVVLEAAKYVAKDSDYISDKLTDEQAAQIVTDYTRALHHRRLTAFGGWMKEAAVKLKADDLDHVDLQPDDEETIRADLAEVIEEYGWHFGAGDYVLARRYVNPLRVKREEGGL